MHYNRDTLYKRRGGVKETAIDVARRSKLQGHEQQQRKLENGVIVTNTLSMK